MIFASTRFVSGHEFIRAERISIRVNGLKTSYFRSAEGQRAAPAFGAERVNEGCFLTFSAISSSRGQTQ